MSTASLPGSGGNTAVITQLRQALDGDTEALDVVIKHIQTEPDDFVEELRNATAQSLKQAVKTNGSTHLPEHPFGGHVLPKRESILMEQINVGFPAEVWDRYHVLVEKLDDCTLTPEEHKELMDMTNRIEIAHAKRLTLVLELAQLRGKTLEQMMKELGLVSPGVR